MQNFFINNPIFTLREDVCKVLVEVYGADIDIRDFSGKKANSDSLTIFRIHTVPQKERYKCMVV